MISAQSEDRLVEFIRGERGKARQWWRDADHCRRSGDAPGAEVATRTATWHDRTVKLLRRAVPELGSGG